MEVRFTPELEKKLKNLAAKTGQAPEQLLEDALTGYETSKTAALDWSQCAAVERVPGKVSGAWVLRGTRMPVATIFENLEAGANLDDILQWYDARPLSQRWNLFGAGPRCRKENHSQALVLVACR